MGSRSNKNLPFGTDYFCNYYKGYRNKFEDLFESEKHFIQEFVAPNKKYLDIGCAVGGMYEIMNSIQPSISYAGVDLSPEMIKCARKNYPSIDFQVYDGMRLPFNDNSFDRVLTLGTTVHDPLFEALLTEAYRVAIEVLFFDIRLIRDCETINSVEKGYVLDGSGVRYPYVVVNWWQFKKWLVSLAPLPSVVKGYGYWGCANEQTTLPKDYEKICMSTYLLYKAKDNNSVKYELQLPFDVHR